MTMTPPPGWTGDDRRKTDPKLEAAMAEVRHLYGSVEELAVAVSRSVPRDEIEAREREQKERERQFRDQAKLIIIGLAVVALFLITYSILAVRSLDHSIGAGHATIHADNETILCVLRLGEGNRTDAAVLGCRQIAQVKGAP